MNHLTLRTLSGITWLAVATGGSALVSLVSVMILARLLTPQDFGLYAIAQAFIGIDDTFGRGGLGRRSCTLLSVITVLPECAGAQALDGPESYADAVTQMRTGTSQ